MAADLAPPSPDGALVTDVLCRTAREGLAVSHPITINADWSVTTGHDLEAERIAVAFGAYNSCIDLVDRLVPAAADAAQRWMRRETAPIAPTPAGRWHITEPCACADRADSYGRSQVAAAHTRSIGHLAQRFGVPSAALPGLLKSVSEAYGDLARPPYYDLSLVTGASAADDLWNAGLSPERIRTFHTAIGARGPMTVGSYLLGLYDDYSPEYLSSVLEVAGSPDVVEWSLTTRQVYDHLNPGERAKWLALGVQRQDVVVLMRASYPTAAARSLGSALNTPAPHAAGVLAAWARSGLAPSVADLVQLHALRGDSWYAPTPRALEPFRRLIAARELDASPTQVGLVLVACGGSRSVALRLLKLGVASPTEVRIHLR